MSYSLTSLFMRAATLQQSRTAITARKDDIMWNASGKFRTTTISALLHCAHARMALMQPIAIVDHEIEILHRRSA